MSYFVSDRKDLLQLDRVHAFLSTKAYWCLGIPLEVVERAAANSLCFGAYRASDSVQVGFARVVTDQATFAWICDVYVEESARGHGISKELMKAVMAHPSLHGLRRICLGTHDAHELYKQFGFYVTKTPENWMEIKDDQIYLRKS
jgi:GNAT superfamily N-acetyltransferase